MAGSPEVGQGKKYDKPLTRLKQDKVCQKKSPAGIFFKLLLLYCIILNLNMMSIGFLFWWALFCFDPVGGWSCIFSLWEGELVSHVFQFMSMQ